MICQKCQNQNPDTAIFCGSCGTKMREDNQEKKMNNWLFLGTMLDVNLPPNFFPPYDIDTWDIKINTPNTYQRGYQNKYHFQLYYEKKSNALIPKQLIFGTKMFPMKNISEFEKWDLKNNPGYSMLGRKRVILNYYNYINFDGVLIQFVANDLFFSIAYYEVNEFVCKVAIWVPYAEKDKFYQSIEEYYATLRIDTM